MSDLQIEASMPLTRWLQALYRIASNTTGIGNANRVSLGYKRWSEAENWHDIVTESGSSNRETQGWVSIWFNSYEKVERLGETRMASNAELVVWVPKNDSSWMTQAIELANTLLNEWMDPANYEEDEPWTTTCRFSLRKVDTVGSAGLAYFSFGPDDGAIEAITPC